MILHAIIISTNPLICIHQINKFAQMLILDCVNGSDHHEKEEIQEDEERKCVTALSFADGAFVHNGLVYLKVLPCITRVAQLPPEPVRLPTRLERLIYSVHSTDYFAHIHFYVE